VLNWVLLYSYTLNKHISDNGLMIKSNQLIIHDMKDSIKIFDEKKVRTVWDEETEEWYFSIVDVVN